MVIGLKPVSGTDDYQKVIEESEQRTFYELLGLERDATTEQVKEAYREIARVFHPDSNFYDEIIEYDLSTEESTLFKDITAAYQVLIHKSRREEYDKTLPPELRGWEDEVTEEELLRRKLEELGLQERTERAEQEERRKAAAYGVFGDVPLEEPVRPQPTVDRRGSDAGGLNVHHRSRSMPVVEFEPIERRGGGGVFVTLAFVCIPFLLGFLGVFLFSGK